MGLETAFSTPVCSPFMPKRSLCTADVCGKFSGKLEIAQYTSSVITQALIKFPASRKCELAKLTGQVYAGSSEFCPPPQF